MRRRRVVGCCCCCCWLLPYAVDVEMVGDGANAAAAPGARTAPPYAPPGLVPHYLHASHPLPHRTGVRPLESWCPSPTLILALPAPFPPRRLVSPPRLAISAWMASCSCSWTRAASCWRTCACEQDGDDDYDDGGTMVILMIMSAMIISTSMMIMAIRSHHDHDEPAAQLQWRSLSGGGPVRWRLWHGRPACLDHAPLVPLCSTQRLAGLAWRGLRSRRSMPCPCVSWTGRRPRWLAGWLAHA